MFVLYFIVPVDAVVLFQIAQQLLFTLYLLAANPEVQDKAYEEVRSVAPEYPAPLTAHNISSVTYLRACMKESSR